MNSRKIKESGVFEDGMKKGDGREEGYLCLSGTGECAAEYSVLSLAARFRILLPFATSRGQRMVYASKAG